MEGDNKKRIDYPAELTFKSIFRYRPSLKQIIISTIAEHELQAEVSERPSRNGKFISITITAQFPSEDSLNNLCDHISILDGYYMMF